MLISHLLGYGPRLLRRFRKDSKGQGVSDYTAEHRHPPLRYT